MNKLMKRSLVLGLILCLILCAALLVACDPKNSNTPNENGPSKDAKTIYTVTVTSEDSAALTNVKVQLKNANGETVAEKALEQGKATFELAAADYTVTLTGVPEKYTFTEGKLSATQTDCTISMSKFKYVVNINYPAVKDVYGNIITPATPAEGVTVSLYEGQLEDDNLSKLPTQPVLAATKKTNANGRAEFDLDGEIYTAVISGLAKGQKIDYRVGGTMVKAYTVSEFAPTLNLPLQEPTRFGSSETVPISMKLGVNDLPLTKEILEPSPLSVVYYEFTPEETGTYTFTTAGNAKIIDGESAYMDELIRGSGSFTLQLETGKSHALWCGISSIENMHYTVTITKGGDSQSDPTVSATPFTTFEGAHTVEIKAGTSQDEPLNTGKGKIDPVWYSYTATEGGKYKITDTSENDESVWIYVCKGEANHSGQNVVEMTGDVDYIEIDLEAGVTYYFWICTWSETPGTVSFNIEKM